MLPGQYYDSETGLHYNYFRYYDPQIGRYITSDPIGLLGGLNTYGYVGGNPLKWIDRYGLYTEVYVFRPVGWKASSFGHVAVNINGTVYSWGTEGLWVDTVDNYLAANDFRSAVGSVLKLTSQEELKLQEYILNYGKENEYGIYGTNCGDPIESGLESLGYELGVNLFPVSLGNALDDAGLVNSMNFYPATNPPEPHWYNNAPWANK